jgi:peptidoglycan/LPS O-acetylase OafA/YrhL
MSESKSKNHSIELVRIFACLLVILAHIQIVLVDGTSIVTERLFFSTAVSDDVPLFLLVTGFFFFNRVHSDSDIIPTFPYKAKSFLSRIYIPTIIYILINILYRYFTGPQGSILTADWAYLGNFVFKLNPGDHLWYICTYMSFIFFFPLLAFVCQDTPQKNEVRRILLSIAIAGAVITDLQYFFRTTMLDIDKYLWGYCTIFLIIGYELSLFIRKSENQKKKMLLMGIGLYILGFAAKILLQKYMHVEYGYVQNRFRWLQCSLCFVTTTGLFLTIYTLGTFIKNNGIPARIINFIGSCTFGIYLFHHLIIKETKTWQFELIAKFTNETTLKDVAGYYFSYALIVLAISFVTALIFRFAVEKPVAWIFNRKKKTGIPAGPSGAIPDSNPSS